MISKARLKFLRSLKRRKNRVHERALLLEGINLAEEAARSQMLRELYVTEGAAKHPRVDALLAQGHTVVGIDADVVAELTDTESPPGLFAWAEDPCGPLDVDALPRECFVLVANEVADPGNMGSLIRTAAALGLDAVVTTKGAVDPTNSKVVRASAGAIFRIPVRRGDVVTLKQAEFVIHVGDTAGEPLDRRKVRPWRYALVLGNEPRGVQTSVRDLADGVISIPMSNDLESLNVAVAGGILMHALQAMPASDI